VQGRERSKVDLRALQAFVNIESFLRNSLITRIVYHSILVSLLP
jgi:hypothetical protein